MSWEHRADGGLVIRFNRDELKTRSRAEPPKEFLASCGLRFLAPVDPDGGGTWLAVNEKGIVLALLNRWHQMRAATTGRVSRGGIVQSLAGSQTLAEVEVSVASLSKQYFSPFTLVAIEGTEVKVWGWDGQKLFKEQATGFLTSSSFSFPEVKMSRARAFEQATNLSYFHMGPAERASAYTVRMNRPDAQTWSRSTIEISSELAIWKYEEEFPNLTSDPENHLSKLKLVTRSLPDGTNSE